LEGKRERKVPTLCGDGGEEMSAEVDEKILARGEGGGLLEQTLHAQANAIHPFCAALLGCPFSVGERRNCIQGDDVKLQTIALYHLLQLRLLLRPL
jgi:hypothetical protein